MNIMKVKYLFAIAAIIALIASCSQKEASKPSDGAQYAAGSDKEQVKRDITDFFNRMREGDKTVLYENEFPYYKANYSLNDYYSFDQIMVYQYDTMKAMTVDSVTIMGDTAMAYITVSYELRAGGETTKDYPVRLYRSGDHWIKPSMSNVGQEAQYEAFKRGEKEAEQYNNSGEGK